MDKQAFDNGFCQEMARRGIGPGQMEGMLKLAIDWKEFLQRLAIGLPIAAGGIGGYMLGTHERVTPRNIEGLKAELLAREYADAISETKREQGERDDVGVNKNLYAKFAWLSKDNGVVPAINTGVGPDGLALPGQSPNGPVQASIEKAKQNVMATATQQASQPAQQPQQQPQVPQSSVVAAQPPATKQPPPQMGARA